ncbi:hypothetical protein A4R26_01560 [Niastella populi]|uniref:Uncharacterized protein n=1 Tax=Niastella populi TaxID=550983 RepID=A0A1V9GDA1_9BACT|nr:hypothetical protein A4R26_01560 [Niastella populi]
MTGTEGGSLQIIEKNALFSLKPGERRQVRAFTVLPDFLSFRHLIYYCPAICYYGRQPIILPGLKN